jgi:hypothetical protein
MKNKLILIFIISLLFTLPTISCNSSNDLTGTWKGSYRATQGETGLTLNVYNANNRYEAIFDFYNLPGKTNAKAGKYYMYGSYNESTKKYKLIGYEWIEHPEYYVFVDLEGKISKNIFSGSVYYSKNSLDVNQYAYREYYAKLSEETEKIELEEFTFRVIRKSRNFLGGLIHRIL